MRYIRAFWRHDHDDDPVELWFELDADCYEVRKVDIFRDGSRQRASAGQQRGSTVLSERPIPSLEELNAQDEFEAFEMSREDFEVVWQSVPGRQISKPR
ncbi:MAG TPA: hypothetical protein VF459_15230 [Caulobacteraceae bacterium]